MLTHARAHTRTHARARAGACTHGQTHEYVYTELYFVFSTIVTVYAVESALPDEPENEMMDKVFIKQDDLFGVLSKNLEGLYHYCQH